MQPYDTSPDILFPRVTSGWLDGMGRDDDDDSLKLGKIVPLSSVPPFFKRESHCVWGLSRQLGLSERGVERSKARSQGEKPSEVKEPLSQCLLVGGPPQGVRDYLLYLKGRWVGEKRK
jgi:hypothetical protein